MKRPRRVAAVGRLVDLEPAPDRILQAIVVPRLRVATLGGPDLRARPCQLRAAGGEAIECHQDDLAGVLEAAVYRIGNRAAARVADEVDQVGGAPLDGRDRPSVTAGLGEGGDRALGAGARAGWPRVGVESHVRLLRLGTSRPDVDVG